MHKSWQLLLHVRAYPRQSVSLFAVTDRYDDDLYIYIVNRENLPLTSLKAKTKLF